MTNSSIASIWISVFQFLFLEKGEDKAVDRPHKSSSSLHVTRFVPHTESIFCPFRNWIIVTFYAQKIQTFEKFQFLCALFLCENSIRFLPSISWNVKKSLIFDQWSPNILKAKFKIFCKYENAPDATFAKYFMKRQQKSNFSAKIGLLLQCGRVSSNHSRADPDLFALYP